MESKYNTIKYSVDEVEAMRKQHNMDTEEKREEVFKIIEEWLLKQDHHVKKKYSKAYLERCLLTCKGSIERTKRQIDFICTMRTLLPHYFQITNLKDSDLMETAQKMYFCYTSRLTKDYYRVLITKVKPNVEIKSTDFLKFQKLVTIASEFLKSNDYFNGLYMICDTSDANTADVLSKVNLTQLQQYIPISTEGYGCRIAGIIFLTASTFVEGFVKMIKPLFKEKIRNRIHVVTNKECLKEFIVPYEILPADYDGTDKKMEELHDELIEILCSESTQQLMKEMNAACTDETKRLKDQFNEQYLGLPGSFRTINLD